MNQKITSILTAVAFCFFFGLIIACLYSLISAEMGLFSWVGSTLLCIVFTWACFLLNKKRPFIPSKMMGIPLRDFIVILILFLLAGFLYWPPSEYILGGWDPGVYLTSGACISKYHSINFFDEFLSKLSPEERSIFISAGSGVYEFFPGMRVMNPPDGNTVGPQFFHMYPTLLAWAFGLARLQGSLAVNPLIGLACIVVIYALCRAITHSRIALLGAALLFANPVQIWMARFQNSEMLVQLYFLLGFLFLFSAHLQSFDPVNENSSKRWLFTAYILSALCFWIALLTRYDFLLVVVPISAIGICSLAWETTPQSLRRARLVWLTLLGTGMIHTFIHHKIVAYRYYPLSNIFEPAVAILIAGSIILTFGIRHFFKKIDKIWKSWSKYIRWTGAIAVFFAAIYATFIRPQNLALDSERFNFLNLASFVSEPIMILALIGIITTLLNSKRFEEGVFILTGVLVTTIVIHNKFIDPFYLWGARRFIPVAFPFLFVAAVLGFKYMLEFVDLFLKRYKFYFINRWASTALSIGFAITYFIMTQPNRLELSGFRDFSGLTEFFQEMSKKIPQADLIVTQERGVAEILHFYYDLPAVYLRNTEPKQLEILQSTILKRLKENQKILILTQDKELYHHLDGLTLKALEEFTWKGKRLNDSRSGFPKGTKERGFDLILLEVSTSTQLKERT